jgi:hypothetical protein
VKGEIARSAARGIVAAMAMTGLRTVTEGLGWLERSPPDAIADEHARELLHRAKLNSDVAIELAHWGYGGFGGAAFGMLPERFRRHAWSGPLYGLAIWLAFETGLAPLLGLRHAEQKKVVARLANAADHVLYGVVVAGSWPHEG